MGDLDATSLQLSWEEANSNLMFLPTKKEYGRKGDVKEGEWKEALEQEFELTREMVKQKMAKASKMENKLKILTGGYRSRARSVSRRLVTHPPAPPSVPAARRPCCAHLFTSSVRARGWGGLLSQENGQHLPRDARGGAHGGAGARLLQPPLHPRVPGHSLPNCGPRAHHTTLRSEKLRLWLCSPPP